MSRPKPPKPDDDTEEEECAELDDRDGVVFLDGEGRPIPRTPASSIPGRPPRLIPGKPWPKSAAED